MKRAHRKVHRALWVALALLIAAGLTMALVKRKPQKKAGVPAVAVAALQVASLQVASLEADR